MTTDRGLREVTFEVLGEPVPKKRARVVDGHAFTPGETVAFEAAIGWAFRAVYQGAPLEGPLRVHVTVREQSRRPQQQGDLDNYVKSALDALNGLAWRDDREVVAIHATVNRHAVSPGMVIDIYELAAKGVA